MYDYLYKYDICSIFLGVAITCQIVNTGSVTHFRDAALRWDKALEHSHSVPSNSPGEMVVLWGFDGVSMGKPHTYIYIYIWIIINPFCGNKIGYIMIYIYIFDIHWNTVIDCILHDVWVCLKIGIYYHLVPQHCHHERENHQMQKRGLSLFWDKSNIMADWWFGTLILWFSIIAGNFIIPIDELHHFSEG